MLVKLLINAGIITGIAIGGVLYLGHAQDRKFDTLEAAAIKLEQQRPVQAKKKAATTTPKSASVLSIPKDSRSGQYQYRGRVNSGYVNFLVDTGASAVALTANDATKAGIRTSDLNYDVPVSTAGGTNYAARVKLDQVSLGGIMLRDVDALVIKEGLHISLLGMTWLGQLQEVKATPNALLLRY